MKKEIKQITTLKVGPFTFMPKLAGVSNNLWACPGRRFISTDDIEQLAKREGHAVTTVIEQFEYRKNSYKRV